MNGLAIQHSSYSKQALSLSTTQNLLVGQKSRVNGETLNPLGKMWLDRRGLVNISLSLFSPLVLAKSTQTYSHSNKYSQQLDALDSTLYTFSNSLWLRFLQVSSSTLWSCHGKIFATAFTLLPLANSHCILHCYYICLSITKSHQSYSSQSTLSIKTW